MAFSDDEEEEALLHSVSNYYFHDEKDEAVCFSQLPLQLVGKECLSDGSKVEIFLRGVADDGLLPICKQVTAWRFDLSNVGMPVISVLSKENRWLKLQKPRKSYEPEIRSVLITVHCLHLLSRKPDLSVKSLWEQLAKTFSLYEVKPSQNDLVDHMDLIAEAVKSDDSLAKSKFLLSFLEEKPQKKKLAANENARATSISGFIVNGAVDDPELDDSNHDDDPELDDSNLDDVNDDLYDSVCSICDNGGALLCCDGRCMRSFHPTADEESARESACESLGLTPTEAKQAKALETFLCKNCEHNQHQCFACGKLGSSDKSSGAEVFRCSNATCGRFYHPHCVAKLLHREDKVSAEEHGEKISAGELFTCPAHKCCVCQQGENKKVEELQFALCRRCPTSYHRKCLPREIAFDDIEEEGVIRAWDGLLDNRVLIYCLKHEIDDELGTPKRDHIKFPFDETKKRKASDVFRSHEKAGLKKKSPALESISQERTAMKAAKQSSTVVKAGQARKKSEEVTPGKIPLKKVKTTGPSKKLLRQISKPVPMDVGSAAGGNKTSLGDRLFTFMTESDHVTPGRQYTLKGGLNKAAVDNSTAKSKSLGMPSLDADSEKRLLQLMKEAESSITLEDIIAKQNLPSTHKHSSRSAMERITLGKIEGSVEAARMALAKLEGGCSIDDAQAVCEPEVLNQILNWQNKLRVYLAPFLYGMRYTSFGRHFTKVDRLKEIVDRLHWYVQDGDTVVDFCCGANDFSLILKRKLEETGKKCSFKNYDIFQAKNDFNFERKDWMSVKPKELPKGSKLIMGLNPPFGVKAALANKFIDKALEFKPKLLILIVPPETERLDEKKSLGSSYELVWEDNNFLSGKSFYLPGSVDANDKQMDQWNMTAPPLYLWSRSDFSVKHKSIAEKHGHLPKEPESLNHEMDIDETPMSELPLEDAALRDDASELKDHLQNHEVEECKQELKDHLQNHEVEECKQEKSRSMTPKVCSPHQQSDEKNQSRETWSHQQSDEKSQSRETSSKTHQQNDEKNQSRETSNKSRQQGDERNQFKETSGKNKRKHSEENHGRGTDKKSGGRTPRSETHSGILNSSPSNVMGSRSSVEGASFKSPNQHQNPNMHGSHIPHGTSYGDIRTGVSDDMVRRYTMTNDPYSVGARSHGYGHYTNEIDREFAMRSQAHFYGQTPDLSAQRNNLAGLNSGYGPTPPSYGQHLGATTNPSYRMHTSATQRYAPRLDELNYARMGPAGPEPPMANRNAFYDPRPPFMADPRAPRPPFPMGFAPGPYHPYPHQNSAGWLNE
ncbi:ENHANCED DOWNY MILDEW 2 [Hibiscus trionum]|uniref:ENHANCED DOWNY MILDEW 2 n=1 Tax=Hibiscus trionum TaxID=183268 RepID=A0A9W7IYV6_HIBTR|nr:ENHANCED DOWNY MILDEW 2 [Hibiscus trionum]